MKKGAHWNSKSRKVLFFTINNHTGFHLVDERRILNMWRTKRFQKFDKLIAVYNYELKSNEIAKKMDAHNDLYLNPKRKISDVYILKPNEIFYQLGMKSQCCVGNQAAGKKRCTDR
jgi:hypothetical protein